MGQDVSRTRYARLFRLIGTTFGSGDGETTFTLPDLRGRSIVGSGTGEDLLARVVAPRRTR
jgi:microcystin-dependent protein